NGVASSAVARTEADLDQPCPGQPVASWGASEKPAAPAGVVCRSGAGKGSPCFASGFWGIFGDLAPGSGHASNQENPPPVYKVSPKREGPGPGPDSGGGALSRPAAARQPGPRQGDPATGTMVGGDQEATRMPQESEDVLLVGLGYRVALGRVHPLLER